MNTIFECFAFGSVRHRELFVTIMLFIKILDKIFYHTTQTPDEILKVCDIYTISISKTKSSLLRMSTEMKIKL